ncbi:hypothetical protein GCM10011575_38140 [Microlunatus endophyticus]|uniref:histidine kinase n=1 Tax=Microlunatus endophyticus TaxID=1716077 RepID=A0A917SF74_9ACTN|nr:hypothetical protein GCM10011575_38140 [Microlunatus endophyticus]
MDRVPNLRVAIARQLRSNQTSGVLLRLLMAIAAFWYSVVLGAFSHATAETVVVIIAFVGLLGLLYSGFYDNVSESTPLWPFPVAAVVCVLGGVIAAPTNFTGWFLFGTGCVILVGRPRAPYLLAAVGWGAGAITLVALQVRAEPTTSVLLWNTAGVLGILLLGITRRQSAIRRQQQAELVERSRQLEQRSLELIKQTEQTRTETARAAALEERNRIARDLHDLLAHALGGLVVQLDAAEAVLDAGGGRDQVGERLRTSRQLAVEGLRDARAAVRELRSDERPDTASVTDAVAAVLNGPVGMRLGLRLDIVGPPRLIPSQTAEAFAAVAREAITNMNKHAPGGRASASLIFSGPQVKLELINALNPDRGHGELADSGDGFGLESMQRRMKDVGGGLRAGAEGGRWVVTADWPGEGVAE